MGKTVGAILAALACWSAFAEGAASNRTFVYLKPETSSFWHTAPGSSFELPITYPFGATSASLSVRGVAYARDYRDITDTSFTLTLPEPKDPSSENVYTLTLTFDNGTVRTARIGLIQGRRPGASGAARCLLSVGEDGWNEVTKRAVVPIPHGMTSFTLNGEQVDTGLGGDQGWYALGKVRDGDRLDLMLSVDEREYVANLIGFNFGMLLLVK